MPSGGTMKQVVLIGDSIRMGYQATVREELGPHAEVWGPEANGGTSANVLRNLDEWVISRQPDIVHINAGLHDIKREFGATEPAVSLQDYQSTVAEILQQIQNHTAGVVIWAMITPVNEQRHHATKGFDRFEADVVAYNQAADSVASRLGVRVNYLYDIVMAAGRDELLAEDGVHFTRAGYELLGATVASIIRDYL